MGNNRLAAIAGCLAVGLAGAMLCAWLGTPLPWMIGPLVAMAMIQFSGASLQAPPLGREAGQLVVGISLGLYFSPPVVREIGNYFGYFVALGLAAVAAGAISGAFLARAAKVDRATAWFSSMPGGASEMATLGEAHGALPDRVALAHSVRMLLVVTLVPVAITLAGFSGLDDYQPAVAHFDPAGFVALIAVATAGGLAARLANVPTAFMIGPLFATIALTVSGVELSSAPRPVLNAAQLVLACSLGAQFRQSFLREAPRFVAALLASIAIMLVLSMLIGLALSWGSGVYLGSTLLSASPGGIAEMSITAKVLKIGVPFVTAAHVTRFVIVVLFAAPLFALRRRGPVRDR